MSRPLPRTSRRAALGLGLAAAAAGCSATDRSTTGRRSGATGPAAATGTDADTEAGSDAGTEAGTEAGTGADTALVATVRADLSRAHAQVRAARRAHPALADRLLPLEQLHAQHAAELGGLVDVAGATVRPQRAQTEVIAHVASLETRLQRQLVEATVDAESGALALLLAAMAGGVAQHRSRL